MDFRATQRVSFQTCQLDRARAEKEGSALKLLGCEKPLDQMKKKDDQRHKNKSLELASS